MSTASATANIKSSNHKNSSSSSPYSKKTTNSGSKSSPNNSSSPSPYSTATTQTLGTKASFPNGCGPVIRRINAPYVANRVIRIIDGSNLNNNTCCPPPVAPPQCPPIVPCPPMCSYPPCGFPPPPPYCIPPLRPQQFCCPPCCPPVMFPPPPNPPPPIIIMPPQPTPPSHRHHHPPPPQSASGMGGYPSRFPPPPAHFPPQCQQPLRTTQQPQLGCGMMGENEKQQPIYNNCNFYGTPPNNSSNQQNSDDQNTKPCNCCDDKRQTPKKPQNQCGCAAATVCSKQGQRNCCNNNNNGEMGRRKMTQDCARMTNGCSSQQQHPKRCHPPPPPTRTPYTQESMNCNNKRLPPTCTCSNDSLYFRINNGEVIRGKVPRNIKIETIQPPPQQPVCLPPQPVKRNCGRRRKHCCDKNRINTCCKQCIEKYIDEQVCKRLEQLCIPDPCSCCIPEPCSCIPEPCCEKLCEDARKDTCTGPSPSMTTITVVVNNDTTTNCKPSCKPSSHICIPPTTPQCPTPVVCCPVQVPICCPMPPPKESCVPCCVPKKSSVPYCVPKESCVPCCVPKKSSVPYCVPKESCVPCCVPKKSSVPYCVPKESCVPCCVPKKSQSQHCEGPKIVIETNCENGDHSTHVHIDAPAPASKCHQSCGFLSCPPITPAQTCCIPLNSCNSCNSDKAASVHINIECPSNPPCHPNLTYQQNQRVDQSTICEGIVGRHKKKNINPAPAETSCTRIQINACSPLPPTQQQCLVKETVCPPTEPPFFMSPSFNKVDQIVVKKESCEDVRKRHITVFRHHVPHQVIPNPNYCGQNCDEHSVHPQTTDNHGRQETVVTVEKSHGHTDSRRDSFHHGHHQASAENARGTKRRYSSSSSSSSDYSSSTSGS